MCSKVPINYLDVLINLKKKKILFRIKSCTHECIRPMSGTKLRQKLDILPYALPTTLCILGCEDSYECHNC